MVETEEALCLRKVKEARAALSNTSLGAKRLAGQVARKAYGGELPAELLRKEKKLEQFDREFRKTLATGAVEPDQTAGLKKRLQAAKARIDDTKVDMKVAQTMVPAAKE